MKRWLKDIISELKQESIKDILLAIICIVILMPTTLIAVFGIFVDSSEKVNIGIIGMLIVSLSLLIWCIGYKNKQGITIFAILTIMSLYMIIVY